MPRNGSHGPTAATLTLQLPSRYVFQARRAERDHVGAKPRPLQRRDALQRESFRKFIDPGSPKNE